jgi:LysR family glycine cleavage system transcriptional activator
MNLFHVAHMSRLPPFDGLVAFDAALRHRSMTRAAAELGLTQSAVSHRVRRLEAFMGAPLLRRLPSGLEATPAGRAVADGLATVLAQMAELQAAASAAAAPGPLRVGIAAPLVDHWLARRLSAFASAHPDVQVELDMQENETPIGRVDVRILWTPIAEARSLTTQTPLFREMVFPVCHPALLQDGRSSGDPTALRRLPLLYKRPSPGTPAVEWMWETWFERLNLGPPPTPLLRFTSIGPAIGAALAGAGAVMARSMLVADALAEGRLVRLLPPEWDLPSGKAHVIRWPAALRADRRVRAFTAWLVDQAKATVLG